MTNLKNTLKNIPKLPWVYQFYNKIWDIIYIWKSVNLSSRVNSYFNWISRLNFAKKNMVKEITKIETIITNNARECILLETNLIKKHKPKYNILMKDDKSHTYIKITNDIFPKVIKTRLSPRWSLKDEKKSWSFFGPYSSTSYVNNMIKLTKKMFGHRSCNIDFWKKDWKPIIKATRWTKVPCIDYYIKRCSAPCLLKEENILEYKKSIQNIKNFFNWNLEPVIVSLEEKMKNHAKKLEFEEAGKVKEMLEQVKDSKEEQLINWIIKEDLDIINYLEKYDKFYISKIEIRNQKITWIYNFELENKLEDENEVLVYFLENNYVREEKDKIKIIIPREIEMEKDFLDSLNIKIEVAKIWDKADILKLAYKNAFEFAYKRRMESLSTKSFTKKDMTDLLVILGYKKINKDLIFECNDISHISWNHTVASRSVIENWKTNPSKYRKFKIKSLESWMINDFDSMREIMTRRLLEIKKTGKIPDLIIIDGWKWQLSSVVEILEKEINYQENSLEGKDYLNNLKSLQLVSIAKKEEELFLPHESESIIISKESTILRMIQKIRDEAHRFAITFNRDSRIKASKRNILEELPWIWPKTRQKLLKEYWNIENIQNDENLKKILNKNQIETLEEHGII